MGPRVVSDNSLCRPRRLVLPTQTAPSSLPGPTQDLPRIHPCKGFDALVCMLKSEGSSRVAACGNCRWVCWVGVHICLRVPSPCSRHGITARWEGKCGCRPVLLEPQCIQGRHQGLSVVETWPSRFQ